MEGYGATCVYVVDSGGAMTMRDVADRFDALRQTLPQPNWESTPTTTCRWASPTPSSPSNTARNRVDASLAGMGAGAGNAPLRGVHRRRGPAGLEPWVRSSRP